MQMSKSKEENNNEPINTTENVEKESPNLVSNQQRSQGYIYSKGIENFNIIQDYHPKIPILDTSSSDLTQGTPPQIDISYPADHMQLPPFTRDEANSASHLYQSSLVIDCSSSLIQVIIH